MQEILNELQKYPWASQQVADSIATKLDGSAQRRMYIAGIFAKSTSTTAYKTLLKDFTLLANANKQENKAEKELEDSFKEVTRGLTLNNVDGLGAIAGLYENLAKAGDELDLANRSSNWLRDITRNSRRGIKNLGALTAGGIKFAGAAGALAGGIGVFAATLINSQDKIIKTMIDIGLADENMGKMSLLRYDAARLGMSFEQFGKMLAVSSKVTAKSGSTAINGALKLGEMIDDIASNDEINRFGMRTKDVAMSIATIAEQLYESNQISSLNPQSMQKITDVFATTQSIALALATSTGINRKEMLAQLEAQREDSDFRVTFAMQREAYIEKYGEEAFDNFKNSTDTFLAYIASTFGRDSSMYRGIEATFKAGAYDIMYDRTILNDMTDELRLQLQEMGPTAFTTFTEAANRILTGQSSEEQAVVDASNLLGAISAAGKNRRLFSVDSATQQAQESMTTAQLVLDKAKNITIKDLQTMMEDSQGSVQFADDSIKTVDNIAKAMMQTLEALLPGLDSIDATLDVAYWTGDLAVNIIDFVKESVGYRDYGNDTSTIQESMNRIVPKLEDVVLYKPGSVDYNRQPAGMRESPNGPITMLSASAYIAATQNMWTQTQINSGSTEELTSRLSQLRETLSSTQNKLETGLDNPNSRVRRALPEHKRKQLQVIERLIEEQIEKYMAQLAVLEQSASLDEVAR